MSEQRIILSAPAADLVRKLTAQCEQAKAALAQADAGYTAVVNALAGEHGLTEPGRVDVTADSVALVAVSTEGDVSDGVHPGV